MCVNIPYALTKYFCGKDVASALGYQNTAKALRDHCKEKGVTFRSLPTNGGKQQIRFIDEGNLYRLITHSKLPSAEQFERWVFDEVLPSIRKTGEYKVKQEKNDLKAQMLKTREENVKVRKAQLMYRLSQEVNIPTYKAVLQSHITELLTGEMLLPLPKLDRVTYSAREIGERLGISAVKVGSLTNQYELKTDEYGLWVWDKSAYSNKQVQSFRYYDNIIGALSEIINSEVA